MNQKSNYTKEFISYDEQIDLLQERGLIIPDKARARFLLENISYYRLSGYWYFLLEDKKNHVFRKGYTFEDAFKLYRFDKELRNLILIELEKIEVSIRAKIIYIMSQAHGPFWYINQDLFKSINKYSGAINKLSSEYKRSDEIFLKEFKKKYRDEFPPSWMIMEVTSLGSLSLIYKNLKPGKLKREIANYFRLPDKVFESWLHTLVYTRNLCAHHSRLWNRKNSISPERLIKSDLFLRDQSRNRSTYFVLSMIKYFLGTVNPSSSFLNKVNTLFKNYPEINKSDMGFPEDWNNDPVWLSEK